MVGFKDTAPNDGVQNPNIVRDHLLTIPWGDAYPRDLLELTENEQWILDQTSDGSAVYAVARREKMNLAGLYGLHHSGIGKLEAAVGLDQGKDIANLSPLAQKVIVLNSIFADKWHRGHQSLMNSNTQLILENAQYLDEVLGQTWKSAPSLIQHSQSSLKARIDTYDGRLGSKWRHSPIILVLTEKKVMERTLLYDQWFGDSWYERPGIVASDPETVISSVRALKTVGITLESTHPGTFFNLLITTVDNKRQKAFLIRKYILGHTQVRIQPTKVPMSELVRQRLNQTEKARELEAEEIEEYKEFIKHMGAASLVYSWPHIRDWAASHDYGISQEALDASLPDEARRKRTKARLQPVKISTSRPPKVPEPIPARTEMRDGREYTVVILPSKVPRRRSR